MTVEGIPGLMATQTVEHETLRGPDYTAAERFLPWNAEKLVYRMLVEPNWLDDEDRRQIVRLKDPLALPAPASSAEG